MTSLTAYYQVYNRTFDNLNDAIEYGKLVDCEVWAIGYNGEIVQVF